MRALLLLLLLLALPALAGEARPLIPQRDVPGEGGDAVLPSGYGGILWGASSEAVQAIRGRPLERQTTPDPHTTWLIDVLPPGDDSGAQTVKWRFWDDQLTEAQVYFRGPFTTREGQELKNKFESRYGDAKYDRAVQAVRRGEPQTTEERWTWQDPFTAQLLRRTVDEEAWVLVRQSRVLQARRLLQDKREREEARSAKVRGIELD